MTVAISENRKQTITDALVQHGVEPTDSALAAVVEMMTKEKLGIKEACAKLAQSYGQAHQQKAQTGMNAALKRHVEKAKEVGSKMGRQMTNLTADAAMHQYMQDLADGTCFSVMMDKMDDLESAMVGAFESANSSILGGTNAPLLLESSAQEIR